MLDLAARALSLAEVARRRETGKQESDTEHLARLRRENPDFAAKVDELREMFGGRLVAIREFKTGREWSAKNRLTGTWVQASPGPIKRLKRRSKRDVDPSV